MCEAFQEEKLRHAAPWVQVRGVFSWLQACTQSYGDITLHQFDQLVVQVSVDSRNIQHQKVVIKIVEPKASPLFSSSSNNIALSVVRQGRW